jgi:hypothetical protein
MPSSIDFDAYLAANPTAASHPVGVAYLDALRGICRGRVTLDAQVLRGFFTSQRWLELAAETDGARSAWAVAPMSVAGRMVETIVLIGDMRSPQEVVRVMAKARAGVAGVIIGGSKSATLLGEGVTPDGRRTFIYSLPGIDRKHADDRLAAFVKRNDITLSGEPERPARKRAVKAA